MHTVINLKISVSQVHNFQIQITVIRMSSSQKGNQPTDHSISVTLSIPCAFHKDKLITNFCTKPSCLLPMCPICISIHSDQHKQENTHGQFERYSVTDICSIQQVIQSISGLLLKTNKSLEDLSEEYTEDYWNKERLLDSCRETIQGHKKKLIKEIQRKFQEIQHKITRKINEFQDRLHDRYKSLESQIQYLYDSINKQREDFASSNDKILKNVICFYSQRKEDKIKEWQAKFRAEINELKVSSIKVLCDEELYDTAKSLEYFFKVQQFKDQDNEYLISTGRELIGSRTKRKNNGGQYEGKDFGQWEDNRGSRGWVENKENMNTVRPNASKYNSGVMQGEMSVIEALNEPLNSRNGGQQWSLSKI